MRPSNVVQRVLHAPAIHFKGKGFHNTDYGTKRRNRELEKSAQDGAGKTESKAAEKKESASAKPSDSSASSSSSASPAKKDKKAA